MAHKLKVGFWALEDTSIILTQYFEIWKNVCIAHQEHKEDMVCIWTRMHYYKFTFTFKESFHVPGQKAHLNMPTHSRKSKRLFVTYESPTMKMVESSYYYIYCSCPQTKTLNMSLFCAMFFVYSIGMQLDSGFVFMRGMNKLTPLNTWHLLEVN
jgi:hypothetical protein